MGLRDFTLFDIVERNARLHPNRLAFLLGDERVTHAAYRARAERLGAGLARAGVRPGDRVGVVSQNNLEFVDLYGAVARLGAILVPVNWRLSADEVAYVVSRRGAESRDRRRRQSAVAASGALQLADG